MTTTSIVFALVLLFGAGMALAAGYLYGRTQNKARYEELLLAEKSTSEHKLLEVQTRQNEALREARDENARFRATIERENAERRTELQRQERRIQQKEETLERKIDALEQRERKLITRERALDQTRDEVETLKQQQTIELERIAQLTEDQAQRNLAHPHRNTGAHRSGPPRAFDRGAGSRRGR